MSADLDNHALANVDWTRLTRNQRDALRILVEADGPIQPREPRAFRQALYDLWRLRLASRQVRSSATFYEATFLGRRVHQQLGTDRISHAPRS